MKSSAMKTVVVGVIQRDDRRILIGQRRRLDSSPLKWEFPGGKMEEGETPEDALARELHEELSATLTKSIELGRVQHEYADRNESFEIRFFAAAISSEVVEPITFEQIAWVLPRELGQYDFLAANKQLIAQLATGRIKPSEILEASA
ncbi:MAG TPA: (deoxy)nucleoside triphosphate pyrophosphohydrolase [Candidatus Dormibacteraeota bacterium]|jgi:8-oxo-dGTP diphosphatase|nr:(deoxy)nucleoside triphosphate pyrophosphohydrolase [Candidatus Dormibacteraeota bacterium]